jgi:uncharacterized protein
MPIIINLIELREHRLTLAGRLPAAELGLDGLDELIHAREPLEYRLQAELMNTSILLQGSWRIVLDCECSRCLKRFRLPLEAPDWACHVPLEGEDKAAQAGESVDLTPFLREDILLMLPQHPSCGSQCRGLQSAPPSSETPGGARQTDETSGAWAELNKLKFD